MGEQRDRALAGLPPIFLYASFRPKQSAKHRRKLGDSWCCSPGPVKKQLLRVWPGSVDKKYTKHQRLQLNILSGVVSARPFPPFEWLAHPTSYSNDSRASGKQPQRPQSPAFPPERKSRAPFPTSPWSTFNPKPSIYVVSFADARQWQRCKTLNADPLEHWKVPQASVPFGKITYVLPD